MSAIAFDTHAFVKRLTAAGMPESQAEALADEQSKLIEKQLATKADLAIIRSDIEILKHELTVRVGGMIMALGGVLVAIKFPGH